MTRIWREPPGEWIEDEPDGIRFWQAVLLAVALSAPFWIALAWMVI